MILVHDDDNEDDEEDEEVDQQVRVLHPRCYTAHIEKRGDISDATDVYDVIIDCIHSRAASPAPSSRAQITDNHSPGAIDSRLIATDDDEDDDDDNDDNDDDNDDDDDDDEEDDDDDDDDDDDKFLYAPLYACIFIGIDVYA
ncbi:hypothetical protein HZH66_004973 [Vespula vulgaris]|uniref:Uncharacterized protein n=1 Tax=Vespula vulgaris TaxID=7454 RepID=A0A834KEZ5_VESVU|nr:hypothetical protein HZH66_004973 [Vespula vulgaris]